MKKWKCNGTVHELLIDVTKAYDFMKKGKSVQNSDTNWTFPLKERVQLVILRLSDPISRICTARIYQRKSVFAVNENNLLFCHQY